MSRSTRTDPVMDQADWESSQEYAFRAVKFQLAVCRKRPALGAQV